MVSRTSTELKKAVLDRNVRECRTPGVGSPLPTPKFFFKEQTFSTKKERQTPRECPPPTPRPRTMLRSCPPASRLFEYGLNSKAQSVTFKGTKSRLSSKYYDADSDKLYLNQCFDIICKVGSGSFGEVFKVQSKEDGKFYAVKRSKERFRGKSDRLRKLEEVKKHEQLPKHQNCVAFFNAWEERGYLYIQTELCETSLSQYTEENHDIPESTVWNYLVDLLLAVKHLHDHNLVHLDIKPDNIFISEDNICKLGDFGLVFDISKGDIGDALEGDPKYLAPELMQGHFTKAADVFSVGITILELACDLDLPRGDSAWHQLRQGQIPTEFIQRLSPALTEVICKMMEPDYKTRPSVDDILKLPAVLKVYRKRRILFGLKSLRSSFMVMCHWIAFLSCWVKSFVLKKIPYFQKNSPKKHNDLATPTRDDTKRHADWDYSFSDDEVFEGERSSDDVSLDDVCGALFKDSDEKPKLLRNSSKEKNLFMIKRLRDKLNLENSQTSNFNDTDFDESSGSPYFTRFSPHRSSSPKSMRRSPRLAKQDLNNSSFSLGPKNLLDAFEEELSDRSM